MGKLEIPPEDLKRIPAEYLAWVELSDGPVEYMDDPIDEVINHRRLPGEGEFDIPGYVEACQRRSATKARGESRSSPRSFATCPIEEEFKRAYETTAAQFGAGVTCEDDLTRSQRWNNWTTTGSSGCSPRCCGSASSRSGSSGPSRSIPA